METVGEIYNYFTTQLSKSYELNEAEQITILAFENVLNYRRIDISLNKSKPVSRDSLYDFQRILNNLLTGQPIQYILGKAWFYGMNLTVNENVLIPRRETEELVDWIIHDMESLKSLPKSVVDVCTGSGCIALALKKKFMEVSISGIDLSEKALEVARSNALHEKVEINLIKMDALDITLKINPGIIISNPPYVLLTEKSKMHKRVTKFEPPSALFVNDEDPLLFYKKIANWGFHSLIEEGRIYFEINERMGEAITDLLLKLGFHQITLRKDLQGKDRMIRAIKNSSI